MVKKKRYLKNLSSQQVGHCLFHFFDFLQDVKLQYSKKKFFTVIAISPDLKKKQKTEQTVK